MSAQEPGKICIKAIAAPGNLLAWHVQAKPYRHQEIEGKHASPSRSVVTNVIFITVAIIFLFAPTI
jgi:hypothetical protein